MSHMAAIELQITDLECLEEACKNLGLQLNRNQSQWRWYGRWMNDYSADDAAYKAAGIKPEEYGNCAEHVITIPGSNSCYEIGVVKRRDGQPGWVLLYDFFAGGYGMSEKIDGVRKDGTPKRYGLLEQAYAISKSAKQLRKEGFKVKIKQEGKQMQCVATRPKAVVKRS